MKNILIVGYGKIGKTLAELFAIETDFIVSVADKFLHQEDKKVSSNIKHFFQTDIDTEEFKNVMKKNDIVVCATPFYLNQKIASIAAECQTHYFDFTEDTANTEFIIDLAKTAKTAFVPQCGLAPGFINILAFDLYKKFEKTESLKLRVGALPLYNSSRLHYNITWSVDGLINEYANPSYIIHNGQKMTVPALGGLEELIMDGENLEAFYTSGGVSTLADTLEKNIDFLDYKTMRYPGHSHLVKFLMEDLKLAHKRSVLKDIITDAIAQTHQDKVYIYCSGKGIINGQFQEVTHSFKVMHETINGRNWTAIEKTTAAGCLAVIHLFATGKLKQQGLIMQTDINLKDILSSPFAKYLTKPYIS